MEIKRSTIYFSFAFVLAILSCGLLLLAGMATDQGGNAADLSFLIRSGSVIAFLCAIAAIGLGFQAKKLGD